MLFFFLSLISPFSVPSLLIRVTRHHFSVPLPHKDLLFSQVFIDLDGVEYEDETKTTLNSAADTTVVFEIPSTVTKINGGQRVNGAFFKCRTLIESVSFAKASNLKEIGSYCFNECKKIKEIDLSNCNQLTSIKTYVFFACNSLEKIILPQDGQISTIERSSFAQCISLLEITIPKSVTTIEGHNTDVGSFNSCISLKKVIFTADSNLKTIGWLAFMDCKSLETFNIPASADSLASDNFLQGCDNLKEITVDSKNTKYTIASNGLYDKATGSLIAYPNAISENVILPNVCKYISQCFRYNKKIRSVTIPPSVISIWSLSFGVSSISSIVFESGSALTSIGSNAFQYCLNLKSFVIPKSVNTLTGNPFSGAGNGTFTVELETGGNFEKKDGIIYSKSMDKVFFYAELKESYSIEQTTQRFSNSCFSVNTIVKKIVIPINTLFIENYCFTDCSSMETFEILSDKLQSIGLNCFHGCKKLTNIIFPSNIKLESIGIECFLNCYSLESFVFPKSVKTIGFNLFKNCLGIKKIEFEDMNNCLISTIPKSAFTGTIALKSFVFPSSISEVEVNIFEGSGVENVTIPENTLMTKIAEFMFFNAKELEFVNFPLAIKSIEQHAFAGCSNKLRLLSLGKGISSIKAYAFNNCLNLATIEIPDFDESTQNGLQSIEAGAFQDCPSLKYLKISEDHKYFTFSYPVLYSKDVTRLILYLPASENQTFKVPDSVESIMANSFDSAVNMGKINITSGAIKSIGYRAFRNCRSLWTIIIPESITQIGNEAFTGTNITMCGTVVAPAHLFDQLLAAKIPKRSLYQCPPTHVFTIQLNERKNWKQSIPFYHMLIALLMN